MHARAQSCIRIHTHSHKCTCSDTRAPHTYLALSIYQRHPSPLALLSRQASPPSLSPSPWVRTTRASSRSGAGSNAGAPTITGSWESAAPQERGVRWMCKVLGSSRSISYSFLCLRTTCSGTHTHARIHTSESTLSFDAVLPTCHCCRLPPGVSAIAIALGWEHTCIIETGGGVKCWGWSNERSPKDVEGALLSLLIFDS